ncbi:hypothetical protein RHSIM_Rhsim02G0117900 [Rhododendron simsii]|uniref:Aminotransferase-like plant mobile domain-containing protein n=1 Tax=Rhododendron simsii TaxID=118357 RepID=A0A834LX70_RHOSS|nr:hypothetical protein RHSIM_Rhsim02G0117900 [Rhododendron simsii]
MKKLVGRKLIKVTSSSVPKASYERHAQSQYDFRVKSPKYQGINIEQVAPWSQPLRKRPGIVINERFPVTPALKDSLKKISFWHLINAFIEEKVKSDHCRKFDEVVVKIIESYDANIRTFRLGNKHVKLEREDVKLIFGISCRNEEINQGYCKKEDVQLAVKWKIKGIRLDTSIIKNLLQEKQSSKLEEDVDDIARLLCLFLCGTLFFSISGTTINWVYIRYMEYLNKIEQFDWVEAICKYLLKSTHVEYKDPKEVKGSSILLLYWLCEHSNILNQESPHSIPRLLKWNIVKLRKVLKDVKQLQQLPDEKVKDETLEQTIEEKVDSEFEQHEVQQDQVQQDVGEKDEVNQHEMKNDEFVELVETQFEVKQDEGEKVEIAEVENVPHSYGLDDFDTPTDMFQSPLCSCDVYESQPVSFRRDEVTSPKYNSDSTLEPNTLSGKSLPQEKDECLKKFMDNILDDSKKYASAMIEYLEKQMEIEKQSNKEALTMIDELRKEKDSITNDMSTKIGRWRMKRNQQITALARKIEETEKAIKNQILNLDKQNKKLCLAKDRYIQTLLNKASVLEKQKAKQQDVNNVLQMQIDEFKIHEITQRCADEIEGAVHQYCSVVSKDELMYVTTHDIQTLLFESTFSTRRKLIADYINRHSKSSAGKGIGNTVHIDQFSLQQPIVLGGHPLHGDFSAMVDVLFSYWAALNLESNALTRELPPELGNLNYLEELRLDRNKLRGTILRNNNESESEQAFLY